MQPFSDFQKIPATFVSVDPVQRVRSLPFFLISATASCTLDFNLNPSTHLPLYKFWRKNTQSLSAWLDRINKCRKCWLRGGCFAGRTFRRLIFCYCCVVKRWLIHGIRPLNFARIFCSLPLAVTLRNSFSDFRFLSSSEIKIPISASVGMFSINFILSRGSQPFYFASFFMCLFLEHLDWSFWWTPLSPPGGTCILTNANNCRHNSGLE